MDETAHAKIATLIDERDRARASYFAHHRPGNLTPAQLTAFRCRNMARLLLLKAAEAELNAELEITALLAAEQKDHDAKH